MKTLIVCAGKYGATLQCAKQIASALPGTVDLCALASNPVPDLSSYDTVLLGTSVYMGRILKEMRLFAKKYEDALLQKKLGIFLCCIQDLEQPLRLQMESGFSKSLLSHACAARGLGGRVEFSRLSRFDRFIMSIVLGSRRAKSGKDVDTISPQRIADFVKAVANA